MADCPERAPGEWEIKSKPAKDSFLKKKEGKSAKPCGPSLHPAAAESQAPEAFVKRQVEFNRLAPELLGAGGKARHIHLPSRLVLLLKGMYKILASDSRNIYQEKLAS